MTNHLEIKKIYYPGSFRKSLEFPSHFFFMSNRSSEQVLESSRRIANFWELSTTNFLDLYLAYDIIVVT